MPCRRRWRPPDKNEAARPSGRHPVKSNRDVESPPPLTAPSLASLTKITLDATVSREP
jgi:hypothetical protein